VVARNGGLPKRYTPRNRTGVRTSKEVGMPDSKFPFPPEQDGQEQALAGLALIAKAAASVVPLGSLGIELIAQLCRKPLENRRNLWLEEVTQAIREISATQKDLTPSKLAENPEFVSILLRATDSAMKTHQAEKRELLRNAIVSAAQPSPPDFDKQLFFLKTVDELTLNQILVLSFYNDPRGWFTKRHITPPEFFSAPRLAPLQQAYPEIAYDPFFDELIHSELERRKLVDNMKGMALHDQVYESITTALGREFLAFVRADTLKQVSA
jgi:hypothetical protein